MNPHPRFLRTRRAAAALLAVALGLAGAVAFTPPAAATEPALAVDCGWDSEAGEWLLTWTLTSQPPEGAGWYGLPQVTATPAGNPVEGIAPTGAGDYPYDASQALAGTQRVSQGTTAAALALLIEWDTGATAEAYGQIDIPTGCTTPAPPVEIGDWTVDCHSLIITIDNPADDEVTLRFVPSVGDPVTVGVAGGESAAISFPVSAGLSVDVQHDGWSIVDPSRPIEVTPADLADLTCDDEGDEGGLPATGTRIGLVAAGAAVLVALGVGLYLIARRRRIIFTP